MTGQNALGPAAAQPAGEPRKRSNKGKLASIHLAEIRKLFIYLAQHGVILDLNRCLHALANALASAPKGGVVKTGKYRGRTFGLDFDNLKNAARDAQLPATDDEIKSALIARGSRCQSAKVLAKTFGVTESIRAELKLTTVGATDCSTEQRAKNQAKRDKEAKAVKRAANGATPRSMSRRQTKPWVPLGISEREWYRRQGRLGKDSADAIGSFGISSADATYVENSSDLVEVIDKYMFGINSADAIDALGISSAEAIDIRKLDSEKANIAPLSEEISHPVIERSGAPASPEPDLGLTFMDGPYTVAASEEPTVIAGHAAAALMALADGVAARGQRARPEPVSASMPVAAPPERADVIERAGLFADAVPAIYADTLARLNRQKPTGVSDAAWRQACDDGRRFLDTWGWVSLQSAGWDWTAGELFDVPSGSSTGGLIWLLHGRACTAYGPEYVRLDDGSIVMREEIGRKHAALQWPPEAALAEMILTKTSFEWTVGRDPQRGLR